MSNAFHLAIPAGDLSTATKFYTDILGCKLGNKEEGKWVDGGRERCEDDIPSGGCNENPWRCTKDMRRGESGGI